jgi:hypothetical protein
VPLYPCERRVLVQPYYHVDYQMELRIRLWR